MHVDVELPMTSDLFQGILRTHLDITSVRAVSPGLHRVRYIDELFAMVDKCSVRFVVEIHVEEDVPYEGAG